MALVKIDNCGIGLNSDLSAEELGKGVWSSTENMRFNLGYAERFRGFQQVFSTPSVTPYWIAAYATTTARYIIHAGTAAVYADDGTTRTNITGTAPTGASTDRWTGGSLNGVFVMNNGVDVPTYWAGTGTLASLGGWDATWRCKALRPYRNFLVALNITKGATKYPNMVKWSTTLNPGSITAAGDWDETNPAKDAGEQDLAETPDLLVDCLPLGDANIIYKERSMYAMTYVGAPYIFRFQRLPFDYGMLARGCAVVTPLGHVVLSAGDIVLFDGNQVVSIANGAVRDYLFKNIDSSNYQAAFVTSNPQRNEVWICFPYGTSTTCNKALVWNWVDKTWGIRALSNVTYGCSGQVNVTATSTTWATDSSAWQTDGTLWNENEYSPAEARLLFSHSTPYISLADVGTTDFGSQITSTLERTGIHFDQPYSVKTIRGIRPIIDAANGTQVSIQIGAAMYPDTAPTWSTAQTFTVGSQHKIDSFASGRFFSVRFTNSDYPRWRMKSFEVDFVINGSY